MLNKYIKKNIENQDLTFKEALNLFKLKIPVLGKIADEIRRAKCGDLVTFIIDRNINYTNYCISRCKFCAFYARNKEERYLLTEDEVLKKIEEAVEVGATQILMQGGINPQLGLDWYEEIFSKIKLEFPNIQLHSLSPPEVDYLAGKEGLSVREVLKRLQKAGLDSLPGGGAEVLSERVRKAISPNKISADRWIEVMEEAHRIGMKTTATMMFGHLEKDEDIIEHLFRIRDLQKRTAGFTAFIPWTFQPERTELHSIVRERVPPIRYLQILAISRIVLHNIQNIQASWLTQGFDIAKLALFFGANDFGGTMLEENVVRATGKEFKPARVNDIVRAVKSVGREAAQRTTDYKIIKNFRYN
ncbi:MAG TPA: dehypoxanthine futalosine cyclase [Archaeoglobaceae archaeon]|nr:dehypoxanthine futalosine cyclase [Archaeoglobaceae archaeon]